MRKFIKIAVLFIFLLITFSGIAQGPPDPDPDPSGNGDNGIGGQAPIGNGLAVLIVLGVAYGSNKFLMEKTKDIKKSK